jgi:flagellar biosynthesis protein FlhF
MEPTSFTAASAEEAVALIRAKLGPEAVVLNVRRLPPNGFARLWQKPMIEVLACKPEAPAAEASPLSEALAEFRQELAEIKQQVASRPASEVPAASWVAGDPGLNSGHWRVGAVLRKSGLLPLHTQQVLDRLRAQYGEDPPSSLGEEIDRTQEILSASWRKPSPVAAKSLHVFIGPAGCGKTTYLCKWLTQTVLMEGRLARVWRLDGATANMAESLSVYCEILGAPNERVWRPGGEAITEDIGFIDLPGVDWRKPAAVQELAGLLQQFGPTRIHLVLNGAYDISILLAQFRAFAILPVEDLVITHLDEESSWGKIWNLVLGTNCSIRHFSAGQNIPGDLCEASAKLIFARQFPVKQAGNVFAQQFPG